MSPDSIKANYRRMMDARGEPIFLRRYTGTGPNRPYFDYGPVMAVPRGYDAAELVGNIKEGNRHLIVLAEDVHASGFPVPFATNDKAIVKGRELQIEAPDDASRRVQGVVIAYELRVQG